jgi:hypothetical protein
VVLTRSGTYYTLGRLDASVARVMAAICPQFDAENPLSPDTRQQLLYAERGTTFDQATGLSTQEYAAYGGGMPIRVASVGIVGSFYAGGLPDVEDHDFLVDCLRELKAAQSL